MTEGAEANPVAWLKNVRNSTKEVASDGKEASKEGTSKTAKPANVKALVPRLYQQELFEKACKQNVSSYMACLCTSGIL